MSKIFACARMPIYTLKLDDAFASALEKVSLTKTNVAEDGLSATF